MTDTAEYWNDVKDYFSGYRPTYTCLKDLECEFEHKYETKKITNVSCRSCLKIVSESPHLSRRLEESINQRKLNEIAARKKKNGYKLEKHIRFGKYKLLGKSIKWIIDNDRRYFDWMLSDNVILLHPEVDEYLTNNPVK